MEEVNRITKNTLVPLSLVLSLVGGGGWLTKQHFLAEANAKTIADLTRKIEHQDDWREKKLEDINKELKEITQRLSRIEGILNK